MSQHSLASLPDSLERIGTTLSEFLIRRHGSQTGPELVRQGVISSEVARCFQGQGANPEHMLERFCALALYNDCLTVIATACLNAESTIDWDQLGGIRGLLSRIASFYSGILPRFQPYRTLTRERITDFLNDYAQSTSLFCLQSHATRFLGLSICAYVSPRHAGWLYECHFRQILTPLWEYTHSRAGVPAGTATAIWTEVGEHAQRLRDRVASAK